MVRVSLARFLDSSFPDTFDKGEWRILMRLFAIFTATMVAAVATGCRTVPIIEEPSGNSYFSARQLEWFETLLPSWNHMRAARNHAEDGFELAAVQKWQLAARYGNTRAFFAIGNAYVTGTGVPRDLAKAHAWLSLAQAHSQITSAKGLNPAAELWAVMTVLERERARLEHAILDQTYGPDLTDARMARWMRREHHLIFKSRAAQQFLRSVYHEGGRYFREMVELYRAGEFERGYVEFGDFHVIEDSAVDSNESGSEQPLDDTSESRI